MPDQWKVVRIRTELYERVERLAKASERSAANYVEELVEAGLARAAGRVPHAVMSMRNALAEAEEKGADQAAVILRTTLGDWTPGVAPKRKGS